MLSYDYYPAIMYATDLISQGHTRTQACDKANIRVALFEKYVELVPEFKEALTDAERRGYDAMAEALLDPDGHKNYGRSDAKMAKVMSDNIKWLLDKRKPREYGSKVEITHNIKADATIIAALAAGRNRAAALAITQDVTPVIDAVFTELTVEDERIMEEMFAT